MKNKRQETTRRRLRERWVRHGGKPLCYKRLASYWADWEAPKYHRGVVDERREYKKRLVAERLEDREFKRALETARERLREARQRRDAAWKKVEPLLKSWSDIDYSDLWARYVEANDAYSQARREIADELRAKYKLNRGWLFWLHHYLETGESQPDKLRLYSQTIEEDEFGGTYIRTDIYFPLSKRMMQDIAFWIEFEEEGAFGVYYQQAEGGGRRATPDYKRYFERWEESGFDPDVKKELVKEYLAPIIEDFISKYRKKHGGKPTKREIRRSVAWDRRAFQKALDRRRRKAVGT